MEPGIFVILIVVYAFAFGGYASTVAGAKGYSPILWGLGGVLFGPFALLAAVGLPDLKTRAHLRILSERQGTSAQPEKYGDRDALAELDG